MNHLERALDKQNQWWKYLLIFIAGFLAANVIGVIPLGIIIAFKTMDRENTGIENLDNPFDFTQYGIDQNTGLILLLIPFIVGLVTVILMIKPLHKRSLSETINGTKKIRWNRFFFACITWALLIITVFILDYSVNSGNYQLNFRLSLFIPLVFISLLLIPFQTAYEELLFRGYLMQGFGAWTKNRWFALILTSVMFGLMHSFNPEIKAYGFWLTMPQYILFGLFFGIITVLDDGVELAMGVHASNNILSSVFFTSESSVLQTPAVFIQKEIVSFKEIIILFTMSLFFILIAQSKYKWKFSVLNKKIIRSTFKPDNI